MDEREEDAAYGVTFRVTHGYSSATATYDIAAETRASVKPLTILYVGDWDPSGLYMSENDWRAAMPDARLNILAGLETAASALSDLARCAAHLQGPQREQTIKVMLVQAERVNKLLGAAQRLGNGPPRRRRVGRWRLAMPADKPAEE